MVDTQMAAVKTYFGALADLIPVAPLNLTGTWSSKPQRRYASPASKPGVGPYMDTMDWRWDGFVKGETLLAGLYLRIRGASMRWAKSERPVESPAVAIFASAWNENQRSVSVAASFHGAGGNSWPMILDAEPPDAIAIHSSGLEMGRPHLLAELGDETVALLVLPGSMVRMGRNGLWRVRDDIASRLPPDLRLLFTRSRNGEVELSE